MSQTINNFSTHLASFKSEHFLKKFIYKKLKQSHKRLLVAQGGTDVKAPFFLNHAAQFEMMWSASCSGQNSFIENLINTAKLLYS